uniref:Uncharacterized protein n=1 Tax=Globodera rostochiensis TaxID=31243 RepID=A0A914HBM9_GLORO
MPHRSTTIGRRHVRASASRYFNIFNLFCFQNNVLLLVRLFASRFVLLSSANRRADSPRLHRAFLHQLFALRFGFHSGGDPCDLCLLLRERDPAPLKSKKKRCIGLDPGRGKCPSHPEDSVSK